MVPIYSIQIGFPHPLLVDLGERVEDVRFMDCADLIVDGRLTPRCWTGKEAL